MTHTRRNVIAVAATALAAHTLSGTIGAAANGQTGSGKIKAVGFDAFTIFDPGSVVSAVEESFPDKGRELSAAWRTRQFEYCWLRTLNRTYADFWQVTKEALVFTFKAAKIDLKAETRARLMQAYLELKPWPDSLRSLKSMRDAGLRLACVSNFTLQMLRTNLGNAGATELFEHLLSTDAVKASKPHPEAYRMVETAFKIPRHNILFAPFAGWDAAGAGAFGLETFWVNRLAAPMEELGVRPNATGSTLAELAKYVTA